jgi:acid stress chaperone HdeB
MNKVMLAASGLMLVVETALPARAQVTIDISKITCEQFVGYKIANPDNIAIWVSGFLHGKKNDLTLDTQAFAERAQKVKSYCIRNPKTLMMEAVETTLAGK